MARSSALVILVLGSFLLLFGCPFMGGPPAPPLNITNTTNNQTYGNYTCPDGTVAQNQAGCPVNFCPSTCNDGDSCTTDACGPETNYECEHTPKVPCCGNGKCEVGEDEETCIQDCGACPADCDDNNLCTRDYCSTDTAFKCVHEPLNGNAIGCCGYIGVSGYSNTERLFSIQPPDGWDLDEKSKKSEGGVLFVGPEGRPNCSETEFWENGYYTSIAFGFTIKPPSGWVVKQGAVGGGIAFQQPGDDRNPIIYISAIDNGNRTLNAYYSKIRDDISSTSEGDSEAESLGAKVTNATVKENAKRHNTDIRDFSVSGLSDRWGEWENESQELVIMARNGRFYTVALIGSGASYAAASGQFEASLASFLPGFAFVCPSEDYFANIAVYSRQTTKGYMLADYVRDSLSQIGRSSGYVLLDTTDEYVDGSSAKTFTVSFMDRGFPVKKIVTLTTKKDRFYKLEYTSVREDFDKYLNSFRSATKSFKMMGLPDGCKYQTCMNGTCSISTLSPCCGNGKCESTEDCNGCPGDCGVCGSQYPPLSAELIFKQNEPSYFSAFNCENYLVRVRIHNQLSEPMTIYSNNALRLRTENSDTLCRIDPRSDIDCIATMSGDFGDAYSNETIQKSLTLFGYGGTELTPGETLYSKTLTFNLTYSIYWVGPYCMHFYCIPGLTREFRDVEYNITGVKEHRGDLLAGNWWCNANRSRNQGGITEIYFNNFYNKTCVVDWSETGRLERETCYNMGAG